MSKLARAKTGKLKFIAGGKHSDAQKRLIERVAKDGSKGSIVIKTGGGGVVSEKMSRHLKPAHTTQ
ncbi:hypothetical protein CH251_12990 [Rhodococcus sp. 06-462-5]|uniref:hypothetical protein n=1 Tax=Nocardiaceae TaxID=85025 RepID=UPI00050C5E41|nr:MULTISPECIES: hypothetical protein [Rhodococcus]OZC74032.1 hypothetical protein CH251_12990 [Rhodococcus sp. 06-462-5]OZE68028.1 hypothetical protein CH270_09950 [Rhodococcus sp. 02-925g]OZF51950.1 hypothetical protein CH291_05030 [Rhodococcus sp. 14-1411-2a]